MSKFSNITFPFYGLKQIPEDISFKEQKILVKFNTQWMVLDDKSLKGNYLQRQIQMLEQKYTKLNFNYTCRNMIELLSSKAKWGADSDAIIHDLSNREKFSIICRKIRAIKENLIWVDKISYPFEVNTEKLNVNSDYYVTLIHIDRSWYPLEFSFSMHNRKEVSL